MQSVLSSISGMPTYARCRTAPSHLGIMLVSHSYSRRTSGAISGPNLRHGAANAPGAQCEATRDRPSQEMVPQQVPDGVQRLETAVQTHLSRESGRARRTLLVLPTWSISPKQRTLALGPRGNHSGPKQHFSEEANKQRIYVAAQELSLVVSEPMNQ
jgi:hypothetical protein